MKAKNEKKSSWFRTICVCIILISICLYCRHNYFLVALIPSESMENTLQIGDFVFCIKTDTSKLDHGDICIFYPNQLEYDEKGRVTYIKRLIGLPGDVVRVEKGEVYVNGVKLYEDYVKSQIRTDGDGTYEVPDGCYFFLGDNRDESYDSRYWDDPYIPAGNISYKAVFTFFPINSIKSFSNK